MTWQTSEQSWPDQFVRQRETQKEMIATKMLSILTLNGGSSVTLLHIPSDGVRNDMLGWMRDTPAGN